MDKVLAKAIKTNLAALKASSKNFEDVFEIMFSAPEKILAEENDGFRIKKHTFGEVKAQILHVSSVLSGLGYSDQWIGLEMENSVNWIIAFWSILKSGNKPFLVNTRHSLSLSNSLIKALDIKTVIAEQKGNLEADYLTVSELKAAKAPEGVKPSFANEMALSTSATTLNQVICFYSGEQIAEQLLNSEDIVKRCPEIASTYKGELKQLTILPFYHVFGLFAVYFWFSFFGTTMVFLRNNAPATILKTCKKHKVTHIFAVPMFWHSVEEQLKKEIAKKDEKTRLKFEKGRKLCTKLQNINANLGLGLTKKLLSEVCEQLFGDSVKFCISGGSYIKSSTLEFLNSIGLRVHNGFGMSEVGITSVEMGSKPKDMNKNAIGLPFGSVEYKISENGTLLIKGRSICHSVMINGERNNTPEWFDSKDIVEFDGNDYYIKGRMGDVVIGENGENINPDIIEQEFSIPNIVRFSILGLEIDGKETLSLVAQIEKDLTKENLNALISNVYKTNEKLSLTTAVKAFFVTKDEIMPKNAVKVGRKFLKSAIDRGEVKLTAFSEAAELIGSENATEEGCNAELLDAIKTVVAEILETDVNTLSNDAHLIFDLGADSLKYLSTVVALEEKFGISGMLENEGNCYTIKEIYKFIERCI